MNYLDSRRSQHDVLSAGVYPRSSPSAVATSRRFPRRLRVEFGKHATSTTSYPSSRWSCDMRLLSSFAFDVINARKATRRVRRPMRDQFSGFHAARVPQYIQPAAIIVAHGLRSVYVFFEIRRTRGHTRTSGERPSVPPAGTGRRYT